MKHLRTEMSSVLCSFLGGKPESGNTVRVYALSLLLYAHPTQGIDHLTYGGRQRTV